MLSKIKSYTLSFKPLSLFFSWFIYISIKVFYCTLGFSSAIAHFENLMKIFMWISWPPLTRSKLTIETLEQV